MTQPLNFTDKAITDLMAMAVNLPPYSRQGCRFLVDLLRRAEVFVLPETGKLISRDKAYPEVSPLVFRPPFPVVALEYQFRGNFGSETRSIYSSVACSRRISLAWEWEGMTPGGADARIAPGSATAIASIIYFDDIKKWVPVWAAALIRHDARYQTDRPLGLRRQLFELGRINELQMRAPQLEVPDVLVLLPELARQVADLHGQKLSIDMLSTDLMDEINAYRDFCLAVSCSNVSTEKTAQPDKLNRARIKAGKAPFKDFHTLRVKDLADDWQGALGIEPGHMRAHAGGFEWVDARMVKENTP
ncbi:hypothetical protein [Novosphingobium sp.]|uniref:hypothetical protein n=1 Tax=Novosphingobium sp. TaxID=1874826 RepID=UPI003D0A6FF6